MLRLRLIVLLATAVLGGLAPPDDVVHAAPYTYDTDHQTPADAPGTVLDLCAYAQLVGRQPNIEGRVARVSGASTTPLPLWNATEAVVIGEDMRGRVIPAASGLGAGYYDPPAAPRSEWMENNRRWINDRMDEGCVFYDCGPAPGRSNYPSATSEFYQMELNEIAKRGYPVKKVPC